MEVIGNLFDILYIYQDIYQWNDVRRNEGLSLNHTLISVAAVS